MYDDFYRDEEVDPDAADGEVEGAVEEEGEEKYF